MDDTKETFAPGDSVVWSNEEQPDLHPTRTEFERKKEQYGPGPFQIVTARDVPESSPVRRTHHQSVTISRAGMVLCDGGTPLPFSGVWFKKVKE